MPTRNSNDSPLSKLVGFQPSKGLYEGITKMRKGQRSNLAKFGIPKKLISQIISGK